MVEFENVDVSDDRVELGNGVTVPQGWTTIVRGEEGVPGDIEVRVEYDADLGRVVAADVRVARAGAGDEVTSLTLREVRVQYAVRVGGLRLSTVSEPDHPTVSGGDYIRRMREREDRTVAESITDAARTYELAAAVSLPPLRAVADALSVSQSTATRLMNRARIEGLAPAIDFPAADRPDPTRPDPTRPDATGPIVGPSNPGGPSIGM